ncbi:TetR/AcrR family transcriptional regulator [Ornithinibacillus halophilus]|uniref:Transcriptional regulator, TetR family n=1 Tax=Ornithinibacillus halophilus TaxID=930117 RepID=A0A1M5DUU3_9BACI|nr:TetR/AcrR family transcriptional regulator [Ornithinibacillus halophilus]SHF70696.1 transcriptional regulator, TetR family [Ornithinibacillus halophilus]
MARERKFSREDLYRVSKQLLLKHGYEGFTFSLLAKDLNISRGAIYKYYENKDELLSEYMIYEMEIFLNKLDKINNYNSFNKQFDFLVDLMFQDQEMHQLRKIGFEIPHTTSETVKINSDTLSQLHLTMYKNLQSFVSQGKKEEIIKTHIPDELVLGFIFQTIDIPNHTHIPQEKWIASIKEIIRNGMFVQ